MTLGPEADVSHLRQLSAENFQVVLRRIPGSKDLILKPDLMKPLDKFADMSLIKRCGVDRVFKIEQKGPPEASTAATKVYLTTPDVGSVTTVLSHARQMGAAGGNVNVHLVFLPRVTTVVSTLLEEEGLYDKVSLHSYMWELMPLDHDILSMELPHLFGDLFVLEDATQLSAVPRCLSGLQSLFGMIPNRFAAGHHAVSCLEQLAILEETASKTNSKSFAGKEIGNLIIVDRSLDWATVLLSPLTYEALLDESHGIKCGQVELPAPPSGSQQPDPKLVKVSLNSSDKTFVKIRNKTMGPEIFDTLSGLAKHLKMLQSKMTGGAASVAEMKELVQKNLKDAQSMSRSINLHMSALEGIMEEKGPLYAKFQPVETGLLLNSQGAYKEAVSVLEDAICQNSCLKLVLRLVCLTSLCSNGLYSTDYERLKKMFLQTYGFEHIVTFSLLLRTGLINIKDSATSVILSTATRKVTGSSSVHASNTSAAGSVSSSRPRPNFHNVVRKFSQQSTPGSTSSGESGCGTGPSYVFSGSHCPLVVRLVTEVLNAKYGTTAYNVVEELTRELQVRSLRTQTSASDANKLSMEASKTVLVFFVGGYTMSEVAAFRQLQTSTGYHFIIAGTSNLSGRYFAESVIERAMS